MDTTDTKISDYVELEIRARSIEHLEQIAENIEQEDAFIFVSAIIQNLTTLWQMAILQPVCDTGTRGVS